MALSHGTMSVSRSTNRNGARCGSSFLICSTSRTLLGLSVLSHCSSRFGCFASFVNGVHLPHPFSYGLARARRHNPARPADRPADARRARGEPRAGRRSVTWSAMPTCPPSTTKSPSSQLPAIPTWRRRSRNGGRCCMLWPIWTRLSILVPSPITVSPKAPRSMVVQAPISTRPG